MDAVIFGLIVADLLARPMGLRQPPPPGGLALLDSLRLMAGGNACNVSAAMAKLGMRVGAAGLVGNDTFGAAVLEQMNLAGVDTACVRVRDEAQTSSTVVAVEPGGERCFFHLPGVTELIDADTFEQCLPAFAGSSVVQIGYFGLLPKLTPRLPELLGRLRDLSPRTRIALDTVNPPASWDLLDPILPHLDIFAPSRAEAALLTGTSNPREMVARFRRRMKRGLIGIKLDAEGCYLDADGHVVAAPAYPVRVVDTTGAGDTWFGALLTALLRAMPLEQAARFANRAAADSCTALGAGAGVQSFEQTRARL